MSRRSRSLNLVEHQEPHQACSVKPLPFTFLYHKIVWKTKVGWMVECPANDDLRRSWWEVVMNKFRFSLYFHGGAEKGTIYRCKNECCKGRNSKWADPEYVLWEEDERIVWNAVYGWYSYCTKKKITIIFWKRGGGRSSKRPYWLWTYPSVHVRKNGVYSGGRATCAWSYSLYVLPS